MKQLLIISLFLTLFTTKPLQAQLDIVLSTGLNYSTSTFTDKNNKYWYKEDMSSSFRSDFFIGYALKFSLKNNYYLTVNAQYSRKGFTQTEHCGFCVADKSSLRYSYIDIIPEVEYQIHNNFAFGLGLSYGFKINVEQKLIGSEWNSNFVFKHITYSDFGITGVIRGNFKKFSCFIRYNHGIYNILNFGIGTAHGNILEDVKQYNRNLQIGIGYSLK